jgi:excinuclease ABC subunit A
MSKTHITVKGARVHNLKNITVAFPRKQLTVVTGLSGSGKSSLAFDTLYAEGQRRYVESLSSYARQFLGRLDKPDVDTIEGISPAIAIEQKVISRSSRSTVGTTTEIYDYMKLLFARVGRTYSPISGEEVRRHTVGDVVNFAKSLPEGTRYQVIAPIGARKDRSIEKQLELLLQQGFSRVRFDNETVRLDGEVVAHPPKAKKIELVIDRLSAERSDEHDARLADSVETAFFEGHGTCSLAVDDDAQTEKEFSNRFELDGMSFEEPSPNFFSFNNPVGACKKCEGFGMVIGIDEDLVIPDKTLSVFDDAVVCWKGGMSEWKDDFIRCAKEAEFPIHRAYDELTDQQRTFLWNGNRRHPGINGFFAYLEEKSYKIQYRVMLSRYRGKTVCPDCKGTRLRSDAANVKIAEKSIIDLVLLPADELLKFFTTLELTATEQSIADRLLTEIRNRLRYLADVGLGYLSLNRLSSTLSGGESQRINLSTCLGSNLTGSMYILDEPSIGLHPRDTHRLIEVVSALRDLGNTVIIVEHDEEIMEAADYLVDMGPAAGTHGGDVVFSGKHSELVSATNSLTADYLTGRRTISLPKRSRKPGDRLLISHARMHNLHQLSVAFPLRMLCVVTGVSGSGKSTLVSELLRDGLQRHVDGGKLAKEIVTPHYRLGGDLKSVKHLEYIDQNPIGKSSRSNPVTYVKAYDEIRSIYATQQISKVRGYKSAHFSFNVPGGRCDNCDGEGEVTIEMQFMADIKLTCDVCKGKRFKDEILEVNYQEKNIHDVLSMTIDDAIEFFSRDQKKADNRRLIQKLTPLSEVGLGYLTLGQSSSTLSGGEAQRIKLASFLARGERQEHTVFIFDEPTTGLHVHDVQKLLDAFEALIQQGHSLIVIEHNLDVIKCADWVIDMGPDAGLNGGNVVFEGPPKALTEQSNSHTGRYLKKKFT